VLLGIGSAAVVSFVVAAPLVRRAKESNSMGGGI
jgi:mannitol-specific phosphotransferase system IIBC component